MRVKRYARKRFSLDNAFRSPSRDPGGSPEGWRVSGAMTIKDVLPLSPLAKDEIIVKKKRKALNIGPADEKIRQDLTDENKWSNGTPSPADAFLDDIEEAHPGEGIKESILKEEGVVQLPKKP